MDFESQLPPSAPTEVGKLQYVSYAVTPLL